MKAEEIIKIVEEQETSAQEIGEIVTTWLEQSSIGDENVPVKDYLSILQNDFDPDNVQNYLLRNPDQHHMASMIRASLKRPKTTATIIDKFLHHTEKFSSQQDILARIFAVVLDGYIASGAMEFEDYAVGDSEICEERAKEWHKMSKRKDRDLSTCLTLSP